MKRIKLKLGYIIIAFLVVNNIVVDAQKATPDATGFGAKTKGAYAGSENPRVLIVDNLEDNTTGNEATGRGSFRWALTRNYPRVVIFEVSGYIHLRSRLTVNNPYITIAGQTAPSPGITVRDYDIVFNTSEVIMQHIRCRLGDERVSNEDAAGVYSGPNMFIDHCSFSWGLDEVFSLSSTNRVKNVTITNCIISEGLNPRDHGFGTLFYYGDSIFLANNLFAHLRDRAPLVGGGAKNVMIVNNLLYNVEHHHIYIGWDRFDDSEFHVSVIGNKLIPGLNTEENRLITVMNHDNYGHVYVEDNISPAFNGDPLSVVNYQNINNIASTQTLRYDSYKPMAADTIDNYILKYAGARPLDRDQVDTRVINDVVNGTGRIIDSQREVGGYPNLSQNSVTHTLPTNMHAEGDIAGYTRLEEWLYNFHLELISGETNFEPVSALEAYDNSFIISDNFINGDEVGNIRVYNPTGEDLTYELISGNTNSVFAISSTTGSISINNENNLSEGQVFNLGIKVASSDHTANCEIEITVEKADSLINVNFGAPANLSSWNDFERNGSKISNLKYSNGASSLYNITIWEGWTSSDGGDVSGDCFNEDVIMNYVYTSDNEIRYLTLDNLNNDKAYDIEILSSRSSNATGERGAAFFVNEMSDSINAKGNTCNLVSFENIQPTEGQIQIGYRKRITDSDGHVNAIILTEKEYIETDEPTKQGTIEDENTLPIIVLEYEESANSGTVKNLDASGSFDPDKDNLSYRWVAPEDVSLSNTNSAVVTYLVPDVLTPITKSFIVEVSDGIATSYKSIEITFTPYRPEISKVQVASIKASHFDDNNHPINLLDGDPSTYWSAKGDNHWVSLELSTPVDISHLKLAFHGMEQKKSQFDVLLSQDNENWEPLYKDFNSCGFSSDIHLVDCSSTIKSSASYKYVKILGHGTDMDDVNSISELQVYGSPLTTTSVITDAMNHFKVYPNPASQYFTVELTEGGTVSLFDINGRNLFQRYYEYGEHRIVVDFPSGYYIISTQSDNGQIVRQKLIIE